MHWIDGQHDSRIGPVPRLRTSLDWRDHAGTLGVRWGIGRRRYRVEPGLYAVGAPTPASPVLVTANYKLTVDVLRQALAGRDAWVLVLDTRGVNVWCAAGKGTFSTEEVVRRVGEHRVAEVVSHHTLVLPQLAAPGVAAHEVRSRCGFRVRWGPVRAADLPAWLDAGGKATDEMRRVRFPIGDRLALVGVEVAHLYKLALALLLLAWITLGTPSAAWLATYGALVAALVAGTVAVPALLPWLPGRAFSVKGAAAGAVLVGLALVVFPGDRTALETLATALVGIAVASWLGMGFTGASTYTNPSGVEREMRRAIPIQLGAGVLGVGLWLAGAWVG